MIATTIMISTSVKPACFLFNFVNIIFYCVGLVFVCVWVAIGAASGCDLTTHSLPLPLRGNGRRMNRQIGLRPVRRPKTGAGDVRQNVVVGSWHSWNGVNCLNTVGTSQEAGAAIIQRRALL